MVHFSKFNDTVNSILNEDLKQLKTEFGKVCDFLSLGPDAISRNPRDEHFFDQSMILDIWAKFDSSVRAKAKSGPSRLAGKEVKIEDGKNEQEIQRKWIGLVNSSLLLEIFYTSVEACTLLPADKAELTKKALFKSISDLILTQKVKISNFQIFKIFRMALVQVPRSVDFANYFVQINSQSLNTLDTCLEELAELLWVDNKIVLFKTWIVWFTKVINVLSNTVRNSGEQRPGVESTKDG
jgi:hypothetical protein